MVFGNGVFSNLISTNKFWFHARKISANRGPKDPRVTNLNKVKHAAKTAGYDIQEIVGGEQHIDTEEDV